MITANSCIFVLSKLLFDQCFNAEIQDFIITNLHPIHFSSFHGWGRPYVFANFLTLEI